MDAKSCETKVEYLERRVEELSREVVINRERIKLLAELFRVAGGQKSCDIALQVLMDGGHRLHQTLPRTMIEEPSGGLGLSRPDFS